MDEKIDWLKQGIASGFLTTEEAVSKAVAMVSNELGSVNNADVTSVVNRKKVNWKVHTALLLSDKSTEDVARELGQDKRLVSTARSNARKAAKKAKGE
jgi:hypothetical protein